MRQTVPRQTFATPPPGKRRCQKTFGGRLMCGLFRDDDHFERPPVWLTVSARQPAGPLASPVTTLILRLACGALLGEDRNLPYLASNYGAL